MTGYRDIESALLYGAGVERSYVCSNHDDHNASASVNALTGLFCCYACGHAGKVDTSKLSFDAEGVARFTKKLYETLAEENSYSEDWLTVFDSIGPGPYWLSRFNEETCRYFRLGQAPGVATYPLRDSAGQVLGIVQRDLTGQAKSKYHYPYNVNVAHHLIEAWRCTAETVVLVEGMADVAAVYETGHEVALGSYKAGISKAQVNLLKRYAPRKVICAYDMDDAGEKGWKSVHRQLGLFCNVERLEWDTYGDIAEIPLSERTEMLDQVLGRKNVGRVAKVA